jgi:hypothetical protein
LIAKTLQHRFKLMKCPLLIGPDRLEDDTGAAIQMALSTSSMLAAEKFHRLCKS